MRFTLDDAIKQAEHDLETNITLCLHATGEAEMPRGPKGEKRPADVIGTAVMVGRIAPGLILEIDVNQKRARQLRRPRNFLAIIDAISC